MYMFVHMYVRMYTYACELLCSPESTSVVCVGSVPSPAGRIPPLMGSRWSTLVRPGQDGREDTTGETQRKR